MNTYKLDGNDPDFFTTNSDNDHNGNLDLLHEICIQLNLHIQNEKINPEFVISILQSVHDSIKYETTTSVLPVLLQNQFPNILVLFLQHDNPIICQYSLFILYYVFIKLNTIIPHFPLDPLFRILITILDSSQNLKYFYYSLCSFRILFDKQYSKSPDFFKQLILEKHQMPIIPYIGIKITSFSEIIINPELATEVSRYRALIQPIYKQFLFLYKFLSNFHLEPEEANQIISFILEVVSKPDLDDLFSIASNILINIIRNKSLPMDMFLRPSMLKFPFTELYSTNLFSKENAFKLFSTLFKSEFPIGFLAEIPERILLQANYEDEDNVQAPPQTFVDDHPQNNQNDGNIEYEEEEEDGVAILLRHRDKSVLIRLIENAMSQIDMLNRNSIFDGSTIPIIIDPEEEQNENNDVVDMHALSNVAKAALTMIKHGIQYDTEDHLFARMIIDSQANSFPFLGIIDSICNPLFYSVSEAASYCLFELLSIVPSEQFLHMNEVVYQSKKQSINSVLYRSFVVALIKMAGIDNFEMTLKNLTFLYELTLANQITPLFKELRCDYFQWEGYTSLQEIMSQYEKPEIDEICQKIIEIYTPQE